MTRNEAVSLIKETLGFRASGDASIISWMKVAQMNLEDAPTKPWFLMSERATIRIGATSNGDSRLILPTDFICEVEESPLVYYPDDDQNNPVDLDKEDYDQLIQVYGSSTGAPEAYALVGNYFRIFPYVPEDYEYLLGMQYYKRGTILDTNIENVWLKHCPLLMIGETGKLMATPLRDANALQAFAAYSVQGRTQLELQEENRKHAGRVYQMGGSHV